MKILKQLNDFILFKTIHSKIIITYMVFAVIILFFVNLTVSSTISSLVETLILRRLSADINYIEDLISHHKDAAWSVRGNMIYFGDVPIGDGSKENANLAPFLEHEQKTGTFAYVFLLDKDADIGYVEKTKTAAGYQEGHYLRVAGSTRSPDGNSIVGTYIAKNVSDALDTKGIYSGEANAAGGMIFCLYHALKNESGKVIGAIVVGRNITELKSQITTSVNSITVVMAVIVLLSCVFITFLVSKWTSAIRVITVYLQQLEKGIIPDRPLNLKTKDEIAMISDSVNNMVTSLKENTILRKKSETDALTGLPNRFAYDHYSKYIYSYLTKNTLKRPQPIAVEILDIDYFKEYNDNYGHRAGDDCIRAIAAEILGFIQDYDNIFCCRYGGDEFVIIYNGYNRSEIEQFLKKLKERILSCRIEHKYSKAEKFVTISQGLCFDFFDSRYTIDDYFHRADQSLYDIKKITRNHYGIVTMS